MADTTQAPNPSARKPLTTGRLHELLRYDPATGIFTRLKSLSPTSRVGDAAGGFLTTGYRRISVDGSPYLAHRLAWFYVHGAWPPQSLDHVNGDRADNRLANLRLATQSQNGGNSKLRSDSRTGFKGVGFRRNRGSYIATIKKSGIRYCLGSFPTPEEAYAAYLRAAARLYGPFARAS